MLILCVLLVRPSKSLNLGLKKMGALVMPPASTIYSSFLFFEGFPCIQFFYVLSYFILFDNLKLWKNLMQHFLRAHV